VGGPGGGEAEQDVVGDPAAVGAGERGAELFAELVGEGGTLGSCECTEIGAATTRLLDGLRTSPRAETD
jgi:hypothetical protein